MSSKPYLGRGLREAKETQIRNDDQDNEFWEKEIRDQYELANMAEEHGDLKEFERRKAKIEVLKRLMENKNKALP
jgi:hypothetical protein